VEWSTKREPITSFVCFAAGWLPCVVSKGRRKGPMCVEERENRVKMCRKGVEDFACVEGGD
jgi:hypothetical protein